MMGAAELTRTVHSTQFRELVRFCLVGVSGVIVNMLVLGMALLLGVPLLPAAVLAFVGAATSNYLLNRAWTFRSREGLSIRELESYAGRSRSLSAQWAKFLAASLAGLAVNLVILSIMTDMLHVWYMLGQLTGIGAGTLLNFTLSRSWVFKRPVPGPSGL
jgi:putative flippase GtrA